MPLTRSQAIAAAAVGGFFVWGLLVHWLPVLRYLAYAFVSGAVLSAIGLAAVVLLSVQQGRGQMLKTTTTTTTDSIAFLTPGKWEADVKYYNDMGAYSPEPLYPQSFLVSAAIDELLALVIRDFITYWYQDISDSRRFENTVDRYLRMALITLRDRLLKEDLVDIVVSRFVPILNNHVRDCDAAEKAVRGRKLTRVVTETEELENAIANKYRDGRLHPAAVAAPDPRQPQQDHLRKVVSVLLPVLLPPEALRSRIVVVLLRELLACAVLYPLMSVLADPDTWNQMVEAYGRTTLQDRKTVKKLRAALELHTGRGKRPRDTPPRLAPGASEREFERFVRAIRRSTNLSDARRFRSHIASQLARESMVQGQDPVYIRRLETGKRVLDQKVAKLTTTAGGRRVSASRRPFSRVQDVALVDILRSAAGLSYFMEYMDRQGKMALVQFWIVVDGFRDPLEDDFGDEGSITWSSTDRNDILLMSETHLARPELHVSEQARKTVKEFLRAGKRATPEQYRKARTVILTTQSAVQQEMQTKYYPGFQKSDLYYKYLASDEAARGTQDTARSEDIEDHSPAERRWSEPSKEKPVPAAVRGANAPRRSVESERPLFDDDDDEPDRLSRSEMFFQSADGDRSRAIASVGAVLDDIVGLPEKQHSSVEADRAERAERAERPGRTRPNIASLGLVNTSSRIGVFTDNDLFPDEAQFIEDEYADPDEPDEAVEDGVQAAEPGDLGLSEAITVLTGEIERLQSQQAVVKALVRKAELTNNAAELRILAKSRASLEREVRRKEMQRQQYMIQEGDSNLHGRASVHIKSFMVGKEEDGHEFASYIIEIHRAAGAYGTPATTWSVARRYSEFLALHTRLRAAYPAAVRPLDFPRRRVVMRMQRDFLERRRAALEAYLGALLGFPDVCQSRELRAFLSRRPILRLGGAGGEGEGEGEGVTGGSDLVTRIYNSVADGMDEVFGNMAVFDQISAAGQNLMSAAAGHLSPLPQPQPQSQPRQQQQNANTAEDEGAEADADMETLPLDEALPDDTDGVEAAVLDDSRELEPFVKPLCDAFLDLFDLNGRSSRSGGGGGGDTTTDNPTTDPTATHTTTTSSTNPNTSASPHDIGTTDTNGSGRGGRNRNADANATNNDNNNNSNYYCYYDDGDSVDDGGGDGEGSMGTTAAVAAATSSGNWLRGRAVVVVLHQLLGGAVERRVREAARGLVSDEALLRYVAWVKGVCWPEDEGEGEGRDGRGRGYQNELGCVDRWEKGNGDGDKGDKTEHVSNRGATEERQGVKPQQQQQRQEEERHGERRPPRLHRSRRRRSSRPSADPTMTSDSPTPTSAPASASAPAHSARTISAFTTASASTNASTNASSVVNSNTNSNINSNSNPSSSPSSSSTPASASASASASGQTNRRPKPQANPRPRPLAARMASRAEAGVLLATLVADLASAIVGRSNAQAAARKIWAVMNNGRMNVQVVYEMLDEMVGVVVGEGAGGRER